MIFKRLASVAATTTALIVFGVSTSVAAPIPGSAPTEGHIEVVVENGEVSAPLPFWVEVEDEDGEVSAPLPLVPEDSCGLPARCEDALPEAEEPTGVPVPPAQANGADSAFALTPETTDAVSVLGVGSTTIWVPLVVAGGALIVGAGLFLVVRRRH